VLLQITARADARLVAAAVRRSLRPRLLIARALGWAVLGLALVMQVSTGDLNVALLLSGLFLAAVIPMFLVNTGTRQALRDGHLAIWEITDAGVASSGFESRHAYAWNAFSYVEEAPGQLVFAHSRNRLLAIPTRSLSRTQIDQILTTATGNGVAVRHA
jgi:hypothetical protein